MLDENLPAFLLKPSITGVKHHNEFYLSHRGSEPEPAYHLEHSDPASPSPTHKNCYAAALFDAYNPEVIFGEVLARPDWTKPSTDSQSSIPPAPQPVLPNEFTVQLYNPDQQIRIEIKSSKWGGSDSYEFSMPQDVFRTPSHSSIDKGASDPASLEVTPRLNFIWRKDGKFNKDLTCFLTGKSTDKKKKSSKKDPDISIALWRQMRELTIYEPNLSRVEMEDPKGLEVVLLLSAIVIKDLYFSSRDQLRELFNISDTPTSPRQLSAGGRKTSNPNTTVAANTLTPPLPNDPNAQKRHSLPPLQTSSPPQQFYDAAPANAPPPFPDARAKWELEAETARLKAQATQERAEAERKRRDQDKKDELERRRLQKMVEEEEKAAQKKQIDVDRETERLRKLYGVKPIPSFQNGGGVTHGGPGGLGSGGNGMSGGYHARQVHSRPYLAAPSGPSGPSGGMYVQPSASTSNVMMSGANGVGSGGLAVPAVGGSGPAIKKKKSFWR